MAGRIPRRVRWGRLLATLIVLGVVAYGSTFAFDYGAVFQRHDPLVRTDVARLSSVRVERVASAPDVAQLQTILRDARQRNLKVSISGSRHSQGGHTYTAGGVVLNMRTFNHV